MTTDQRAAALLTVLFGHRWDDLGSEDDIAERFMPVLNALKDAERVGVAQLDTTYEALREAASKVVAAYDEMKDAAGWDVDGLRHPTRFGLTLIEAERAVAALRNILATASVPTEGAT